MYCILHIYLLRTLYFLFPCNVEQMLNQYCHIVYNRALIMTFTEVICLKQMKLIRYIFVRNNTLSLETCLPVTILYVLHQHHFLAPISTLDADYYVTVRAINNIEYGPLVLDVCHAQPYTVDTSPPIIYDIYDISYDEDTFMLSFRVNATYV